MRFLVWILALAALSVGARNFELGLSMDAPLYASIARHIARHGDWFRLETGIPEFHPFAEHPHLGFWVLAAVFKVLPIADWSARVAGHLFYVTFLSVYFWGVRRLANERVAVVATVLLWSWYLFSNIFSSALLDPGVLVFGTISVLGLEAALRRDKPVWAAGAGAALALAAFYKGLTIAGFVPCWAILLARRGPRRAVTFGLGSVAAFVATCAIYFTVVRLSSFPDYFTVYWGNQVTHRFAHVWSVWGFFNREYWVKILQYTYWLAPLSLVPLWRDRLRTARVQIPFSLALGFIFLFSTNNLRGGQYLVMVLPWLGWLSADALDRLLPIPATAIARGTFVLALTGVMILQYAPLPTHAQGPLSEHVAIRGLARRFGFHTVHIDEPVGAEPFFITSRMAWYGDVRVVGYTHGDIPPAGEGELFFQVNDTPEISGRLAGRGWCGGQHHTYGRLWVPCAAMARLESAPSDWRYAWIP